MLKKTKKILIAVAAAVFVYTVVGFFVLPPVLTSVLTKKMGQTLNRTVHIQKIRTNPYTLTTEVRGLSIQDRSQAQAFVTVPSLIVDLEWRSLFKLAPIIRELKLERPGIKITRFEDGTYNFTDLMKGKDKEKGAVPLRFSIANIQITGGWVDMDDRPKHRMHTGRDINIAIPFISNIPTYVDVFVQPKFQAMINRTPVALTGKTKPFSDSLETTLTLKLKDIDLPFYLAYVPSKLGFVVAAGRLDINAELSYQHFRTKQQPILNISAELTGRDLDIKDLDNNPILHLPKISAVLTPSRVLKKQIHVKKVAVFAPLLNVNRDKNGRLNLIQAMRTPPASPPVKQDAPANPVVLDIDTIELTDGGIMYSDVSGSSPVRLSAEHLSITAASISTAGPGGGTVDLACTLNGSGHLKLGSSFTLHPVSADIKLNLDGFQPAWIQPYVIERLPILIRRGTIAGEGEVKLALNAPAPPAIQFVGDVQCADFASVDRSYAEDLVAWKNLSLSGLVFSVNPGRIIVREVTISSPAASYIILSGGQSSLAPGKPAKTPPPGAKTAKQKKTFERIVIGKVMVKNGRFNFKDRSVSPQYATSLTGVSGSITGLSSEEFKKAAVNLNARLDNQSPITITGAVNPLKKDLFVDLVARLNNIELSPATPYSGKYLGYVIDKGKLSLGLTYKIDKKLLQAQNDVLIDQLTFGQSVESKDATKLPVRLAVVLLRDNSGKIDLHLPITGRTDDPDFHVGKIIIHLLINLLEKAATAPFGLLEALYPGASQLSAITFEPGRSTIPAAEAPKLAQLIKILSDRTSLNLEISGFVDPLTDTEGLRSYLFERRLKEQKLKDILRHGKQAPAVDDIVIAPDEFHAYLEKAYRTTDFAKPKNALGMVKTLPDADMQKRMLDNLTVTDNDLTDLAEARAKQVRDYLVASGKIDAGRIFLVKAEKPNPPKDDQAGKARVTLNIK